MKFAESAKVSRSDGAPGRTEVARDSIDVLDVTTTATFPFLPATFVTVGEADPPSLGIICR